MLIATDWSKAAEIELEPIPLKYIFDPFPEPPALILKFGTILAASTRLDILYLSRSSSDMTDTVTGTSCKLSACCLAVTIISSMPEALSVS